MNGCILSIRHPEQRSSLNADVLAGLYQSETSESMVDLDGRHPSPMNDTRLWDQMQDRLAPWAFGFSNLAQLRAWIYNDTWLESLTDEGYMCAVYAGDVRHGHAQAVIAINSMELVDMFPLTPEGLQEAEECRHGIA